MRWVSATFSVLPATTTWSSRSSLKTVAPRRGSERATSSTAHTNYPTVTAMIAQETQNLDNAGERRQFEPAKACAVPVIQARVGADPQLFPDRQQRIDLLVGESC